MPQIKLDWVVLTEAAPLVGVPRMPGFASSAEATASGIERISAGAGARRSAFRSSQVEVLTEALSVGEKAERLDDRRVLAMAPNMPLTLVRPLQGQAGGDGPPPVSWGVRAVGADTTPLDGAGTVVAVLDTGIDAAHEAFSGVQLEQKNFTSEADEDLNGHGTHCAGTIFGRDVDGTRIGVARGVNKALIGKVLGKGGGSTETVFKAITWARDNGAHVISMSLGMDFVGFKQELVTQFDLDDRHATSIALAGYRMNLKLFDELSRVLAGASGLVRGAVVTAAAGNESERPDYAVVVSPPAGADKFLPVGALQAQGDGALAMASFSNEGALMAAPGTDIWSAKRGGGLVSLSGTSMATPHVAGLACLWAQRQMQQSGGEFDAAATNDLLRISCRSLLPSISRRDVAWGMPMAPV